jgi:hypothetical protein
VQLFENLPFFCNCKRVCEANSRKNTQAEWVSFHQDRETTIFRPVWELLADFLTLVSNSINFFKKNTQFTLLFAYTLLNFYSTRSKV